MSETPTEAPTIGWMVITPEGTVIESGPPVVVEMVATVGEPAEEN